MLRREGERGEGRVGLLVALVILGTAIFLAVKIIPVKIAAYEFRDYIEQQCRWGAVRQADSAVARAILEKAEELEIPLDQKNLKVERTRSEMIITCRYEQPIDLKLTTYLYKFDHKERAPLF